MHRDIKPSNLKLTPNGLLKLVDFGLVKMLAPGEVTITILQGQGTALYTPLEQYGGDSGHTDARSDIFAFGGTLYHLLTNEPPLNVRERFLNPDALPRQDDQLQYQCPHRTGIHWALQLHPEDRPNDIDAFVKALFVEDAPRPKPIVVIACNPNWYKTGNGSALPGGKFNGDQFIAHLDPEFLTSKSPLPQQ